MMDEKTIRKLFDISVILKGLHSFLEVVGGIAILFVNKTFVLGIASAITADELAEDPHDLISNYIMRAADQFSVPFQHLAALYLLSHGLVVGFLVAGLLLKKLWSYPITVAVLAIFIVYQTYQFVIDHSLWVLGVTILDIIVILFTWHEYTYMKMARSAPNDHENSSGLKGNQL
ncbi:MAG: DUF2127 domain-containing protein [Patescibacteria group bacterium]|nr:DUF2127 domain-containing protein [Patescibacteria group bacterium]